jgi:uncharacterized protein YcbK (DUF882 family)
MSLHVYSYNKHGEMQISQHFQVKEFSCSDGTDPIFIDDDLLSLLEKIRTATAEKIKVVSGYRTPSFNKKVGGAMYSQHMYGKAADIVISSFSPEKVAQIAESFLVEYGGIGIYSTFTHIDVRNTERARWKG